MTPTLLGRIQTRIFLLLLVGLPWTLVVTPFLPADLNGRSRGDVLGDLYEVTLWTLAAVAVVGVVVWEPIYHGLQQLRWERDWPIMFAFLVGLPEAVVVWWLLREIGPMSGEPVANGWTFITHFTSTWVLVWLAAVGPIRVVLIRWRHSGGQIL